MLKYSLTLLLLSPLVAAAVHAQGLITDVLATRAVHLHADVDAAQRVRSADVAELRRALPIEVLAEDGDIIAVRFEGQLYWVQGDLFLIDRQVAISCADATRKIASNGVVPGAMGRGAGSMNNPCAGAK